MPLLCSQVPRALENKTKLFGFELGDLLLIFLYLSLSNLLFGQTALKFLMVWVGTLTLAGILFFVKRGKPDHYMQHLTQNWLSSSVYSAAVPDIEFQPIEFLRPLKVREERK